MKKSWRFIPVIMWLLYVLVNYDSSRSLVKSRLEAISLSRELTVGGFSYIYSFGAYISFLDELILLIVAVVVSYLLSKKFEK